MFGDIKQIAENLKINYSSDQIINTNVFLSAIDKLKIASNLVKSNIVSLGNNVKISEIIETLDNLSIKECKNINLLHLTKFFEYANIEDISVLILEKLPATFKKLSEKFDESFAACLLYLVSEYAHPDIILCGHFGRIIFNKRYNKVYEVQTDIFDLLKKFFAGKHNKLVIDKGKYFYPYIKLLIGQKKDYLQEIIEENEVLTVKIKKDWVSNKNYIKIISNIFEGLYSQITEHLIIETEPFLKNKSKDNDFIYISSMRRLEKLYGGYTTNPKAINVYTKIIPQMGYKDYNLYWKLKPLKEEHLLPKSKDKDIYYSNNSILEKILKSENPYDAYYYALELQNLNSLSDIKCEKIETKIIDTKDLNLITLFSKNIYGSKLCSKYINELNTKQVNLSLLNKINKFYTFIKEEIMPLYDIPHKKQVIAPITSKISKLSKFYKDKSVSNDYLVKIFEEIKEEIMPYLIKEKFFEVEVNRKTYSPIVLLEEIGQELKSLLTDIQLVSQYVRDTANADKIITSEEQKVIDAMNRIAKKQSVQTKTNPIGWIFGSIGVVLAILVTILIVKKQKRGRRRK